MKKKMNGYLIAGLIITCILAGLTILGYFYTP